MRILCCWYLTATRCHPSVTATRKPRLLLLAAFASRLTAAASLTARGVRRIVGVHLVGAVVGGCLVRAAGWIGLVGVVIHACLVRVTVRIHLISVVILIRFVRHVADLSHRREIIKSVLGLGDSGQYRLFR